MIKCVFENGGKGSLRHVVVHAIVEKDSSILLVKRAPGLLEAGKWGLPSGFLDRDENANQGILRELLEETGWKGEVKALFLIKTDPNRPHEDRQNVVITFIVRPIQQVGKPDKESTDIAWIAIKKLPPLDTLAFDYGESIGWYLDYKKTPYPLPLLK